MSNRIDYFQPEQTSLAMPAVNVVVFVDGKLCPVLVPKEIIRGQWPEFSRAKLMYSHDAYSGGDYPSLYEIENLYPGGKSLSIRAFYNKSAPAGANVCSFSIFEGQIESSDYVLCSDNQNVEITARDYSAALERITVHGQRLIKETGTIFLHGFETVFNPDGKANACKAPINVNGRSYKVFSAVTQNAIFWTYADAIQYLLSEYVTDGQLHIPYKQMLFALTNNQIVRDLDVTGLSLIDALQRCCQRIGVKFRFVPVNEPNALAQAIVFYKDNTGRTIEMNYQKSGQISISKTNISSFSSQKSFQPITHRFIGQGDYKAYEATFELIKAWDNSLEANTYYDYSPSTNPEFYKVRDVFRKWALNESGDYTDAPYFRGNAYEFSGIFQNSEYVHKRRRFFPCLTTDSHNRSLGYYLQISYDNGISWRQYEDAFNLLTDECGIWLSNDQLNIDLILASFCNQLRFRMTASVISDERLSAVAVDGPVNSVIPVVDHVVTLPRQFKYQKISGKSIFAGSIRSNLGQPDEIDDKNALYEFVRHSCEHISDAIETIEVQTPILCFDYQTGDIIKSNPESRDLFQCRNGKSISHIEIVQMDFQNQCTNLRIVKRRVL